MERIAVNVHEGTRWGMEEDTGRNMWEVNDGIVRKEGVGEK